MSGTAQPNTVDAGDVGDAAPPEVTVETRARNMGWTPREQFKGDPARWVDASTFVDRGERMLPLLQERNRALDKTVTDLKQDSVESKRLLADLLHRTRRAEKLGYDRAMRELQAKRSEAVAAGDAEAFNKTEAEIRDLGAAPEVPAAPAVPAQNTNEPNPVVTAWVRRNRWFNADPIANAAAVAALSQVEREFPGDSLEEHLAEVETRIAARFPEHFPGRRRATNGHAEETDVDDDTTTRRAPAVMPSGSATPRRPGARSFEAMPADVRAQYERQKRMMAGKGAPLTKEEYAGYYWDAEGE
jgi:hypothetical protein